MVRANYHDGRTTRVREVTLSLTGHELAVVGDDIDVRVPIHKVAVDERLGNAPRRLRFDGGAYCEVRDLEALDTLLAAMGHQDGWVDRLQRHLPFVAFSIVAFTAVVMAAYVWVLPWAVGIAVRHMSPAVEAALSEQTLAALDQGVFQPSDLPGARRESLAAAFRGLKRPDDDVPHAALLFRKSKQFRANAFTFPDGTIVILDDLVTLMNDDAEILAVLSHEVGHASKRHGLQMLLRGSVVAAFWTFYIGDFSNLLVALPAAVAQARYSQDFEREADDYGAQMLLRNDMSPGRLADALQKVKANAPEAADGGYLSSHPPTEERITRLRAQVPISK